jgi:hypothetical protein
MMTSCGIWEKSGKGGLHGRHRHERLTVGSGWLFVFDDAFGFTKYQLSPGFRFKFFQGVTHCGNVVMVPPGENKAIVSDFIDNRIIVHFFSHSFKITSYGIILYANPDALSSPALPGRVLVFIFGMMDTVSLIKLEIVRREASVSPPASIAGHRQGRGGKHQRMA